MYAWFTGEWVVWGLSLTMLGMGTTLSLNDFTNVFKSPASIGLGVLLQFSIMPALGFLASRSFGLSPALAAGLILVSCCPGGTASNIVTYIARADVALSVLVSICLSIFMLSFLSIY